MTRYHRPEGLNHRNVFLPFLEAESLGSGSSRLKFSWGTPWPAGDCLLAVSSHGREREQLWGYSYKNTNLTGSGPHPYGLRICSSVDLLYWAEALCVGSDRDCVTSYLGVFLEKRLWLRRLFKKKFKTNSCLRTTIIFFLISHTGYFKESIH